MQRNGDVRLEICNNKQPTRKELHDFIKAKLSDDTELIATDENNQYEGIADNNTKHQTVSHTKKNGCAVWFTRTDSKGVWSLFKRSIFSSYHQVSVKHLDRYLDEFEFRFNNRENSFLFRDTLLRLLNSTSLEYKNLIADEDENAARRVNRNCNKLAPLMARVFRRSKSVPCAVRAITVFSCTKKVFHIFLCKNQKFFPACIA